LAATSDATIEKMLGVDDVRASWTPGRAGLAGVAMVPAVTSNSDIQYAHESARLLRGVE